MRPLRIVEIDKPKDLQNVVVQEILQDKIMLAERAECEPSFMEDARRLGPRTDEKKGEEKEIYGSDLKRIKERYPRQLCILYIAGAAENLRTLIEPLKDLDLLRLLFEYASDRSSKAGHLRESR